MAVTFRLHHLFALLDGYESQKAPIDFYVSQYFRQHPALGSKDRAFISEEVYRLIRWRGLADFLLAAKSIPLSWQARASLMTEEEIQKNVQRSDIPLHIRVSMPVELFRELVQSWGEELASQIAITCNQPAPTCVRVNTTKISREKLLQRFLDQGYPVEPGIESAHAICFMKKMNFFTLAEFREGLFEVQDEGSQLVADMVQAKPGERVLDFCSGSGGKTLAFAPKLEGRGQIFLHDVRKNALYEAKKRLKRAGIQNAQIIHADERSRLKPLKQALDWVFVDVPCSGTGTLRRNPDMKWKFSHEMLERLISQQRVIFEQALSFVKLSGYIIYATCSILKQENHEQVQHFLNTYPLEQVGPFFESIPQPGKKDGFFACLFRKKSSSKVLLMKRACFYDESTFSDSVLVCNHASGS